MLELYRFSGKNTFLSHLLIPDRHSLEKYFGEMTSVTRLGNLLDFGQVFKAFGTN